MARPSIFSREYERRMRRRKRRIAIFLFCLICSAGVFFASGNLKGLLKSKLTIVKNFNLYGIFNKSNKDIEQKDAKVNKDIKDAENKAQDSTINNTLQQNNVDDKGNVEDKGYDIGLSGGTKIKAVYEENKDGVKRFKYITPMESANFNINPSGTGMIILDNSTQSMTYVDIDGGTRIINDFKYISSDGYEFPKDEILRERQNYIWCSSPRFIDDNYVAYISQVPWFDNRNTKFVWLVNAKDPNVKDRYNHTNLGSLASDNIKFGNITDKGLEVDTDNGVRYIKFNGQNFDINK